MKTWHCPTELHYSSPLYCSLLVSHFQQWPPCQGCPRQLPDVLMLYGPIMGMLNCGTMRAWHIHCGFVAVTLFIYLLTNAFITMNVMMWTEKQHICFDQRTYTNDNRPNYGKLVCWNMLNNCYLQENNEKCCYVAQNKLNVVRKTLTVFFWTWETATVKNRSRVYLWSWIHITELQST